MPGPWTMRFREGRAEKKAMLKYSTSLERRQPSSQPGFLPRPSPPDRRIGVFGLSRGGNCSYSKFPNPALVLSLFSRFHLFNLQVDCTWPKRREVGDEEEVSLRELEIS
jgi:hypothetical protein